MKASNVGNEELLYGRHKKYEDRLGLPGLQPSVLSVETLTLGLPARAGGGGPR